MIVQKAFKYRFFPSDGQTAQLVRTFGYARYVYNKVARLHAKISDARRDGLRKFTTKIIRENQAIFVEGLNVAGMIQNHNLAKHIADAAFGEIFRELDYEAKWYGRTYLPLDRYFPSSKLCSSCGHLL